MTESAKQLSARAAILAGLPFVYFVLYPEDLESVTAPLEQFSKLLRTLLEITQGISPWLYGLGGVAALCYVAHRIAARIWAEQPFQPSAAPQHQP